MKRLEVKIPGMILKNPIITASGTFGFGKSMARHYDLNKLGAITTKTITLEKRLGNKLPRIAEENGAYLNSIGLENPGVISFLKNDITWLENNFPTLNVIANVGGHSLEEYIQVVKHLNTSTYIKAYEINVSCPNVKEGGILFGKDPVFLKKLTKKIKEVANKPIYIKLTPNVDDIVVLAKAAIDGGADGLTMINTLVGMSICLKTKKPLLGNKIGGVSGPSLKPIAIKAVYDVASKYDIPIIGTGGVTNAKDVLDFIVAGASVVSCGTANLVNPFAASEIVDNLTTEMLKHNIEDVTSIRGCAYKGE